MRVCTSVALSEAGSEQSPSDLDSDLQSHMAYAEMARSSVEIRRAARTLTRLRLAWPAGAPRNILLVRKEIWDAADERLMADRIAFITELLKQLLPDATVTVHNKDAPLEGVDCVVTLGGDGTVLQAAWLFQQVVPPIISFHLGSLGFLTVFAYDDQEKVRACFRSIVRPEVRPKVLLRMRLSCQVTSCVTAADAGQNANRYEVLNEVVIDRGSSAMMATLEIWVDGRLLTVASADGLIVATPTGSTAYSLSAGGPVTHPSVPGILLTPISPHSLAFRPLLLPESACILIKADAKSRACLSVSFDGRERVQLGCNGAVQISASSFPVPTICANGPSDDWFAGLSQCFRWASK